MILCGLLLSRKRHLSFSPSSKSVLSFAGLGVIMSGTQGDGSYRINIANGLLLYYHQYSYYSQKVRPKPNFQLESRRPRLLGLCCFRYFLNLILIFLKRQDISFRKSCRFALAARLLWCFKENCCRFSSWREKLYNFRFLRNGLDLSLGVSFHLFTFPIGVKAYFKYR